MLYESVVLTWHRPCGLFTMIICNNLLGTIVWSWIQFWLLKSSKAPTAMFFGRSLGLCPRALVLRMHTLTIKWCWSGVLDCSGWSRYSHSLHYFCYCVFRLLLLPGKGPSFSWRVGAWPNGTSLMYTMCPHLNSGLPAGLRYRCIRRLILTMGY